MARPSFRPNRAATWKVTQKQRPIPRIVRVGRPAHDNRSRHRGRRVFLLPGVAAALLAVLVIGLRLT